MLIYLLTIRYIFHKFLLYNLYNKRHLKLYFGIIYRRYLVLLLGQREWNTMLKMKNAAKESRRLLSKSQSKHSKLHRGEIPFVFRVTNLCCFSNGYKSQMLVLLRQGNISILRLNTLTCTFSGALLTPADLPAIHFPETVE